MHPTSRFRLRLLLAISLGLLGTALSASAQAVAVFSAVFNGYRRTVESDGTFKPERCTFGEGGCWNRNIRDPYLARLQFGDILRIVVEPLKRVNYLPVGSDVEPELLILVFWGTTQGSNGNDSSDTMARVMADLPHGQGVQVPEIKDGGMLDSLLIQMEMVNRERDQIDDRNARILGYTESLDRARFIQAMSMGRDVIEELGENRYFVVLQAYDFKVAVKEKKLKPLWTTRVSVREHGAFAKSLQNMAWTAAPFFGQASKVLRHPRMKDGSVELGPLKVIGED